jgi:hypothetical protein
VKNKFRLTGREFLLALCFAFMGLIFGSRRWILFLSSLDPFSGLILYYIILGTVLYILSRLGLVVFGLKIDKPAQNLGLLLIVFSFFILVNWENPYIQYVTTGSMEGASPVFYQSEDGFTFWMWQHLLPSANPSQLAFLTYVLTPFILTLIGGLLISRKPRFDLI